MRRGVLLAVSAALLALLTPVGSAEAVEVGPAAPYDVLTMTGSHNGSDTWALAYGEKSGDSVWRRNYAATTGIIGLSGTRQYPNSSDFDSASVTLYPPVGEDRLEAGRTYQVASLADETHAGLSRSVNSSGCQGTGSFTVHELAFAEDGRPSQMAISFDITCPGAGGSTTHGELRWNSSMPFEAVEVSPDWLELWSVVVGTTRTRTVTYRNAGTSAVTITRLDFAGPGAADWSVLSTDCLTTLGSGQSCTAAVAVTPTTTGNRDALLRFTDDTRRSPSVEFQIDVKGVSAPTNVKVAALQGRNVITWQPGPGRLPDRYEIVRTGGLNPSITFKAPAGATSYLDDLPGEGRKTYEVVAYPADEKMNDQTAAAPRVSVEAADRELILVGDDGSGQTHLMIGSVGSSTSITPDGPGGVVTSAPTMAPGGRMIYYTKGTGATAEVWRYDLLGGQYGTLTECVSCHDDIHGADPAYSPDSNRVALVSPTGALLLWHQSLADDLRVVSGVSGVAEPSWLRDSSGLVVASPVGAALRRVLLSGEERDVGTAAPLPGTEGARKPAVSPDNSRVAYLAPAAGGTALRVIRLAGGAPTTVLPGGDLRGVSWTPDGSAVVVTRAAAGGGSEVVSVNVATGATATLFTTVDRLQNALLRLRDLTPPQLSINGPVNTGLNPTITFTAADNITPSSGLRYSCALDNYLAQPCGPTSWSGTVLPGAHTLTVYVGDVMGANAASATHHFTAAASVVDRTPPRTTLTSKRFTNTKDRTPTFKFSANEHPVRFQCRMDRGQWKACNSVWTSPRLTKGKHTFRVRAVDRSGNLDPTPAVHTFRVK